MPKSYSLDLRERVLKDCDAGIRSEYVAKKYSVSASWVYDLRKRRRETGSIAPKQVRRAFSKGEMGLITMSRGDQRKDGVIQVGLTALIKELLATRYDVEGDRDYAEQTVHTENAGARNLVRPVLYPLMDFPSISRVRVRSPFPRTIPVMSFSRSNFSPSMRNRNRSAFSSAKQEVT